MKPVMFLFLILTTSAIASDRFGTPGSDGRNGLHGNDGKDGQNISILADGTPKFFDLRGRRGQDADDGFDGKNATSCYQPSRVRKDLYGAPGGDGGNGGIGGEGGSGGSSSIYFKGEADLKGVQILNDSAEGGRSGRGGDGARGCECSTSNWTIKVCKDRRVCDSHRENCREDRICRLNHYQCRNGKSGSRGKSFVDGRDGTRGSVVLYKGLTELPGHYPQHNSTLGQMAGKTVELSIRQYESKVGAQNLFAPGSSISDGYQLFNRVAKRSFRFIWASHRTVSDFENVKINTTFYGSKVGYELGEGILFKSQFVSSEGLDTLTITDAFLPTDLDRLSLLEPTGNRESLVFTIQDAARLNRVVKTKIYLVIDFKRVIGGYVQAFAGEVPAESLEVSEDQIKIIASKLPEIWLKKLRSKRKINLRARMTREYEGREVVKDLELNEIKLK